MADIIEQIEKILNEVRPGIQADGGDVRLKSVKDGVVTLKINGACAGCPMARLTLDDGVGKMIKDKIEEVYSVICE